MRIRYTEKTEIAKSKVKIEVLFSDKALIFPDVPSNKVHFHTHTDKEKDDVSLYGTPKEEVGTVNTSR